MPVTTFNVQMSCGGCSSACTRILTKMSGKINVSQVTATFSLCVFLGVDNVNCSLEDQKVTVTHSDGKLLSQIFLSS